MQSGPSGGGGGDYASYLYSGNDQGDGMGPLGASDSPGGGAGAKKPAARGGGSTLPHLVSESNRAREGKFNQAISQAHKSAMKKGGAGPLKRQTTLAYGGAGAGTGTAKRKGAKKKPSMSRR
jgi:hypothetical protein